MRTIAFVLLATLASGCTAARGSLELVQAERAIHRAEERGAAEHAVYEYTLAVRYLEKAREELGHNQFRTATDLARTASDHADQAIIQLEGKGLRAGEPVPPVHRDPPEGLTEFGTATPPAPVMTDTLLVQPGAPADGFEVREAPSGEPLDVHSVGDPHEPLDVRDAASPDPEPDRAKKVPRPAPQPEPAPEEPATDDPWKDVPL